MAPQPSPGFRGQSSFAFGGALGQQLQQSSSSQPQTATTPSLSSAATEVGLDSSEFPALGSVTATSNLPTGTTSYATQAGTPIGGSASAAAGPALTSDDFPALAHQESSHPPGLNGFPAGMLNLAPTQARSVHPGFQQAPTETEKQQQQRNYALKLNQATHAAWNSPNTNPGTQPQTLPGLSLGPFANPPPPQNGASPAAVVDAPPASASHPQTPAQQVLMSAADRWGLLGLLAMIKSTNSDPDRALASVGTDLNAMGLDMGYSGNLYSTFITPWADPSAAHSVEPDFHLPSCYNVTPPPPGPNKAAAFSDETLFFMFYSSPRDALQEVAAQELWNRNWRFHRDLRLWITKETGTSPSAKLPGGEQGTYTYWDPESWQKERKEMPVLYLDLEEKSTPVFVQGPGLVLAQQQQQGNGSATQQNARGSFA